ncbi:MAG: GMC oxidoreductase [Casimicrobium sp.]
MPFCSATSTLADATKTGRIRLAFSSPVTRVLTNDAGSQAIGVEFFDRNRGEHKRAFARAVVLCASTLETTRILMNSMSNAHPSGIGGSSGHLGSGLMDHLFGLIVEGTLSGPAQKVPFADIGVMIPPLCPNEGQEDNSFQVQAQLNIADPDAPTMRTKCRFIAIGEVMRDPLNRVKLNFERRDAIGMPTLHVEMQYREHEKTLIGLMNKELDRMAHLIGCERPRRSTAVLPPGGSIHEMGTAKMGHSAASSVVDGYGRCWDVPNVIVADAAVFASSGFQEPTLTIMALAARSAERLANELGEITQQ